MLSNNYITKIYFYETFHLCFNHSSRNLLEEHTNTHTGNRPYMCKCGKDFASKYTYKAHVKTHEYRPRPFECSHCSKTFLSQQNLSQHERTHNGVKEYVCDQCGKFRIIFKIIINYFTMFSANLYKLQVKLLDHHIIWRFIALCILVTNPIVAVNVAKHSPEKLRLEITKELTRVKNRTNVNIVVLLSGIIILSLRVSFLIISFLNFCITISDPNFHSSQQVRKMFLLFLHFDLFIQVHPCSTLVSEVSSLKSPISLPSWHLAPRT